MLLLAHLKQIPSPSLLLKRAALRTQNNRSFKHAFTTRLLKHSKAAVAQTHSHNFKHLLYELVSHALARTHSLALSHSLSLSLPHTRHTSSCPESLVFQHLINCLVIHTYFSIFAVLLTCCCRFTTKFSFITCQLPHTRTRMRLAKTIHKK